MTDGTHLNETVNGGMYWRRHGLRQHDRYRCVAVDPYDSNRILIGGEGLHLSTDGARSWRQVAVGVTKHIAFDAQTRGRVFALIDGRVWGSYDPSHGWRQLTWPVEWNATSLNVDPGQSGALFVGGTGSLLASLDAGDTWTEISTGLNTDAELIIVARGGSDHRPRLYAGTTKGLFSADLKPGEAVVEPEEPVEPEETIEPEHAELDGNYPNPFNAGTTIRFLLAREEQVTLEVFDLLGQMVRRLVTAQLPAKSHQIYWNGRDSAGQHVATGVYVARLRTPSREQTAKMALVR